MTPRTVRPPGPGAAGAPSGRRRRRRRWAAPGRSGGDRCSAGAPRSWCAATGRLTPSHPVPGLVGVHRGRRRAAAASPALPPGRVRTGPTTPTPRPVPSSASSRRRRPAPRRERRHRQPFARAPPGAVPEPGRAQLDAPPPPCSSYLGLKAEVGRPCRQHDRARRRGGEQQPGPRHPAARAAGGAGRVQREADGGRPASARGQRRLLRRRPARPRGGRHLAATETTAYNDTVATGAVISTRPAAGTTVVVGSPVVVVVSKGPHLVAVPNVARRIGRARRRRRCPATASR